MLNALPQGRSLLTPPYNSRIMPTGEILLVLVLVLDPPFLPSQDRRDRIQRAAPFRRQECHLIVCPSNQLHPCVPK